MSRRTKAREVVLQVLYQDDINPSRRLAPDDEFLRSRLNGEEGLVNFASELLSGVRRNRMELDAVLGSLTENWSMDRMAVTDRNVLRLGAFEILMSDTPGRVAVNEAIEIAKRFGSKQSAQFVNGVLDRLLHSQKTEGTGDAGPA